MIPNFLSDSGVQVVNILCISHCYTRTLQGENKKITFAQHSKFKSYMYKYFFFRFVNYSYNPLIVISLL